MPLVNPGPEVQPIEKPHPIQATSPEYRGVTVDTRYTPVSDLLSHVAGSSWTVNYYSQVVDDDNDLQGQVIGRNPILQQYRLIKQMELKVTQALSYEQDDVTKKVKLSGTATVYPFLIPNMGDIFLADIGDGQEAMFTILTTKRMSIFKDPCYEVTYESTDFSTDERREDLDLKTIQTFVFKRDFLEYGQNPILEEEQYALVGELTAWYYEIAEDWFREFTSREFGTLLVPGQALATYDPFHAKAVFSLFTTFDVPELRRAHLLNCDGDDNLLVPTVWDMVLKRNPRMRRTLNERMGLSTIRVMNANPMLNGVYYSGVKNIVYPRDPRKSWDDQLKGKLSPITEIDLTSVASPFGRLRDMIEFPQLKGLPYDDAPLIHRVVADDYYIFSEQFYSRGPNQSKLELAIQDYLERKEVPQTNELLTAFCNAYQTWPGLERFYYTPFVLCLIKASIRSL